MFVLKNKISQHLSKLCKRRSQYQQQTKRGKCYKGKALKYKEKLERNMKKEANSKGQTNQPWNDIPKFCR